QAICPRCDHPRRPYMAIEALDHSSLNEGRYAPLFSVTVDTRPTLFEPASLRLLVELYTRHRQIYAQLQEHWRSIKLRNIPEIDKLVASMSKEALKQLKMLAVNRDDSEPFDCSATGA